METLIGRGIGYPNSLSPNTKIVQTGQTIQSVIDSCSNAAANNLYKIMLPPGDFLITEPLHFPSVDSAPDHFESINYVTIQGSGIGATRILAETDIYTLSPGREFYLKDLTLENTAATDKQLLYSKWWQERYGIVAERVKFKSIFKIDVGADHANWYPMTFIDCIFECGDDQFWVGYDARPEGFLSCYTFINPIVNIGVNNARIFFSAKQTHVRCFVYNPIVTGVTTQASCRPFKLTNGEIHVFNPYIDIEGAEAANCSGIFVRDHAVAGAKLNVYGGKIRTMAGASDIYHHSSSDAELNVYGTDFETSSGKIGGEYKIGDEIATGTYTLNPSGVTKLDSSGGAIAGTLGDGHYIGQRKTIVMTDATASSTVSCTHHVTSDPEVATFDAVDEAWVLEWMGTEWVTIYNTCTFV